MSKEMIKLEPIQNAIEIIPEFIKRREEIITKVNNLPMIDSPESNRQAVALGRECQKLLKETELSRKAVKAPVLVLERSIDEIAESFSEPLLKAKERLGKMADIFQAQEEERVRIAEETRQKAITEALEAKKQAEIALRTASVALSCPKPTDTAPDPLNALKSNVSAKANELSAVVLSIPEPERAKGQIVQKHLKYEITDIKALYQSRPELVRLEPNRGAIQSIIHEGFNCPGIRVWVEQSTTFRS